MPDDDAEVVEELPGIQSGTRWWDPDMPNMEKMRRARSQEDKVTEAVRAKLQRAEK